MLSYKQGYGVIFDCRNLSSMKKKTLIYLVILVIAIGGIVGYRMWNKPHEKVEDRKGIPVTVAGITKEYTDDEAAANKKYLNQAVEIEGKVASVTANQDGAVVVGLQADGTDGTVQCTMRDKDVKLEAGQQVKIQGFCSGNTMFDVLLTDCVVKE